MLKVNFYDNTDDTLLKFAVIVSRYKHQWVFCKHKDRSTYECPGGHRESGEKIEDTAKRELWEETGAIKYDITPICIYAVEKDEIETFGMLYYAEIYEFEKLPALEIEKVELFVDSPDDWTYPAIQPELMKKAKAFLDTNVYPKGTS